MSIALDNIKVQDVAEVLIINDTTGEKFFYGCTEGTGFSKSAESEMLTCGIGNAQRAKLWKGQSLSVTVQTLLFSPNLIAMQTDSLGSFINGSKNFWKKEMGVGVSGTGIEVTITGTPVDDEVTVVDLNNKQYTATYSAGTVTITDGVEGDTYIILYQETEATTDYLEFDSTKFPSNVHLQMHTIAYDVDADVPVADLYWDFPVASPDGNIDSGLNKGENTGTSVKFDIMKPFGVDTYGIFAVVPK